MKNLSRLLLLTGIALVITTSSTTAKNGSKEIKDYTNDTIAMQNDTLIPLASERVSRIKKSIVKELKKNNSNFTMDENKSIIALSGSIYVWELKNNEWKITNVLNIR